MLKQQIQALAGKKEGPCITLALHTHRTHPDNQQDPIQLKNLLTEATKRLLQVYDKRTVANLLQHIHAVEQDIDHNYNLDGLYIFLANDTKTYIRTIWPPTENKVYLDDQFALRDLVKAYNRTAAYYILLLDPDGVQLFEAFDEKVQSAVHDHGFPAKENTHYLTDQLKASDPKQVDNQLKEFLNRIDKNMVAVHRQTPLPVIVAANRVNYDLLLQVADIASIYAGHFPIDHHNKDVHHLAEKAWPLIKDLQTANRTAAINELFAGVSAGKVITDLQEIWQAAKEGRGELLMVKTIMPSPLALPIQVLNSPMMPLFRVLPTIL
ncbi:hypothetical protein [Paraflavitalea speifideaquila]|uniref:baeRF3 domain-containing protein n=1 Tax=Paraflavitalea speifideaquila TaxID=3076558 RepID=UPI0028EAC523|nr:hypothetical protein [Paraflavitalea speifideiaquila]